MSGLVSGLQNRLRRFEPARNLKGFGFTRSLFLCLIFSLNGQSYMKKVLYLHFQTDILCLVYEMDEVI